MGEMFFYLGHIHGLGRNELRFLVFNGKMLIFRHHVKASLYRYVADGLLLLSANPISGG